MSEQNRPQQETGAEVIEKLARPKRYKVLMHNDDYTTMEFVVYVLQRVFGKSLSDAQDIMLKIHNQGMAVCGIYTYEIAESKLLRVQQLAKQKEFPLKCSIEVE